MSFEFDQTGMVIDCFGKIKDGGNADHDYAGSGLAQLYETARRRLTRWTTQRNGIAFSDRHGAQAWLVLARRAEQNASAEILLETTSPPLAATAA